MTSYDDWADVYDTVYSYVREDVLFYVDEAVKSGGPVLELGCGTGRVTVPIVKADIEIVGIDSSSAMLDVARRKLSELDNDAAARSNLVHADMRDVELGQKFPLAIIPFRGFLDLISVGDQVQALCNIRRHLVPGGRLIFNVFAPDLRMLVEDEDVLFHQRDITDPKTGRSLVLWQQTATDTHNQIMSVRIIADELDQDGTVSRRFYRDYQMRYAHRLEIQHLLYRCGYEVLELFGDFDLTPFDETSEEMIWVVSLPIGDADHSK